MVYYVSVKRQAPIEEAGGGDGAIFGKNKELADGGRREETVMDDGRSGLWKRISWEQQFFKTIFGSTSLWPFHIFARKCGERR